MKKSIVGVLTHPNPDLSAPYFVETFRGLTSSLGDNFLVNPSVPVEGWVLLGPSADDVARVRTAQVPVVLVNGEALEFPGVDLDNRSAAREVVRYLLRQGHRRVGLINGKLEQTNGRDRREGYLDALREAGVVPRREWEEHGRFSREEGRRALARLLALPESPTAVFAANDHMALGALDVLKESGRSLAVAGFDDVPEAAAAELTTVHQPLAEMAQRAGAWVMEWIHTGRPPHRHTERWPGRLVVRRSTEWKPTIEAGEQTT